jgi:hypothetical protein
MSNNQNQNKPGDNRAEPSLAQAAAAASAVAPDPKNPLKVEEKSYPATARVRAVHGRSVHLYTGAVLNTDSDKKIDIDGFARAQLDSGKWEIVTD